MSICVPSDFCNVIIQLSSRLFKWVFRSLIVIVSPSYVSQYKFEEVYAYWQLDMLPTLLLRGVWGDIWPQWDQLRSYLLEVYNAFRVSSQELLVCDYLQGVSV